MLRWLLEKWSWFTPKGAAFLPWIGAAFFVLSAGFGLHSWLGTRSSIRTEGTVTENVATAAPDGETVYATHIRFRLPTGQLITTTDPVPSGENADPDFAPGTEVPILYQPVDPHSAIIATKGRIYSVAIILGVIGVFLFDFGLILWFMMRRRNPVTA